MIILIYDGMVSPFSLQGLVALVVLGQRLDSVLEIFPSLNDSGIL